jgi:hypothetical protein
MWGLPTKKKLTPSLHGLFSQPRQFFSHGSGFLSRTFYSPVALPSERNDSFFIARLSWKLTATDLKLCWNSTLTGKLDLMKLLLEAAASSQTLTTVRSPRSDTTMSGQRQRKTEIHTANGDSIEHTVEWLQCLIL